MNHKKIILAAAAVVVLAAALFLIFRPKEKAPEVLPPDASSSQSAEPQTPDQSSAQAPDPQPVPDAQPDPQTAPRPEVKPIPAPAPVTPSVPESSRLSFPCTIPGTTLVIQDVKSYDGLYLEDGSDSEISGVTAIILKNTGNVYVDLAKITLTGSETTYEFNAVSLAPGASMVVQEAHKAPAIPQQYVQASAEVALTDGFELSEDALKIEETDDGRLKVTNISGKDIPCVRLFYKFYMPQEQVYVGGITYTAKLVDLKAGASVQVSPSHYAVGGSKVIMARLYETAEG